MIETALFIGRFQPLHNGHVQVMEILCNKYKNVIIGIGSSQCHNENRNPFTFEERKKMIDDTLKNKNLSNFKIYSIPDINDPPNWVNHVLSIVPSFDIVITNNYFTRELFRERKFKVKKIKTKGLEKNICATNIRKKIKENKKWEHLVPEEVVKIIKNSKSSI